jgi:DNA-binding IclR family transcriptional regulator
MAVIGATAHFDSNPHGPVARALRAAARRLSWRFGALGTATLDA